MMAKFRDDCKGCQRDVSVTNEPLIYYSDSSIEDLGEFVNEGLYHQRVQICLGCSSLQYGTTCKHSGALIGYIAKQKNKRCPMPGAAKW
jgi:hypothetical protein